MKRLFTIIAAVLLTLTIWAQSPQKMSYQAVIRDEFGVLVTNHAVGMRISILQSSSSGTVVYSETQTPTTNANGLVSIEIGGGAGFDAINWANYTFFIKTETDPTGGTNYTAIVGTSQLLSVPYALHAKTVASYNETDPVFAAHPSHGITSTNITNWNTAYGWGNHSGLYRPISYVPSWSEITSNPFSLVSPVDNQLLKYNTTSSKFENWTPNFLTSFTETDPIFAVWDKSTGISITASQVSDFQSNVTNNAAVLLNTAKNSYPTADATKLAGIAAGANVGVVPNTGITGGTKTKITYDTKGLVTAGADATTSDIAASTDKNYVTNAQLTVIANTSGTNTGDQNLASVLTQGTDAGNKKIINVNQQGIGTATPNAGAALEISSTAQGFLPPRMTQVQRDAITPVAGLIVYNASTKKPNYYDGTEWENFDGTTAKTPAIGDSYQGGKVAYILQLGDPGYVDGGIHGLIAAPSDQSAGQQWGCYGTTISGADGTAIGTGNQNTIDIVTGCTTAGIAAKLCYDLTLNGYTDWYLPSKDELNKLYLNKVAIGGFANVNYWSSSEHDNLTAWSQLFINGSQDYNSAKNNTSYVRAVRSF
jgi:hypothetical protein